MREIHEDGREEIDSDPHKQVAKVKFGTAGIRGLFGQEVSLRETIAVCFAVNQLLEGGRFGVGYDSRSTSFVLATVAGSAMNWYGSDVEDFGLIPTPVLAYNIRRMHLHAGLSVTASHNPAEYAGVKVFGTDGIEFSLEEEHKVEELVRKSSEYRKHEDELVNFGTTTVVTNCIDLYSEAVMSNTLRSRRKFKILVDCANGTSVQVTPRILSELGHEVVTVNSHSSKSFPGRTPEPIPETLEETAAFARFIGADFGIAHDGDADRLVMIDRRGVVVPDYAVCALVLKIILERVRRGTLVISYNSSDALERIAKEAGCVVERSRLGKTFQELYSKRGIYACEPSKMVDPKWGYWEDGIYAAILITQYLSEKGMDLDDALGMIPRYYNYRKDMTVSFPLNYVAVKQNFENEFFGEVQGIEEIDGVKLRLSDGKGWLMLRSSGTENKVRVYCESLDKEEGVKLLQRGILIAEMSQMKRL